LLLALVPSFAISVCESRAELVVLGPNPYLSGADSPFYDHGSTVSFFLEDFEDAHLNAPGLFQPFHGNTHAVVLGPGELTDSVDADDGVVDGRGQGGHSLAARLYLVFPTDPPLSWSFIQFGFDRDALGQYPNVFGFVWTDGVSPSDLLVEFLDQGSRLLDQFELGGLGDGLHAGETGEDRFLGFVSDTPFAFIRITNKYDGPPYTFEIDHVQYGVIAEPGGCILSFVGIAILVSALVLTSHRRRRTKLSTSWIEAVSS
jgi:hypothetical protein